MAKKDRSAAWEEPEFDEVKFMRTEMRTARATIAVVLWTLPAAGLSYGLTLAGVAVVAFFAGIGMMFLMKWVLPFLRVDVSEYKRKDWIGHGATFFFSWLAFWILLLNPPFVDLTNPVILSVAVDGANLACGGTDPPGGSNVLAVRAGDNVGVTLVKAGTVTLIPQGGVWTESLGNGNYEIVAYDASGHASVPCSITIT